MIVFVVYEWDFPYGMPRKNLVAVAANYETAVSIANVDGKLVEVEYGPPTYGEPNSGECTIERQELVDHTK